MPSGAKLFTRWVVDSDLRRICLLRRNFPLAQSSLAGTLFQWDLEGWSNRIVDSNQAIYSTLQVDSTIRLNHPSGLIRLRGFDSTKILVGSSPRIDSTPKI